MGKQNKLGISWCDYTFNPWIGCRKVSPACMHCYAETLTNRFGGDFAGTRRLTTDAYWKQPIQWNREAEKSGTRARVFCASLADVFEDWDGHIHDSKGEIVWHEAAGETLDMNAIRDRLFDLIIETPNLDWLLLTKRPENIWDMWPKLFDGKGNVVRPRMKNVWLGTTVENQEQANKRIPELLKCRDLSPVLFLSCEPLLGAVNLRSQAIFDWCQSNGAVNDQLGYPAIDWVIVGGESGNEARPMHPDWARDLRDQCGAAQVAFHFKQWGEYCEPQQCGGCSGMEKCAAVHPDGRIFKGKEIIPKGERVSVQFRVGKKQAGRLLDGREWNEVPR